VQLQRRLHLETRSLPEQQQAFLQREKLQQQGQVQHQQRLHLQKRSLLEQQQVCLQQKQRQQQQQQGHKETGLPVLVEGSEWW